jgi:predicted nucleotidyltransferase
MDLSHPIESIIPSAHGPVLAVLASTEAPLTGRGVAALLDGRVSIRRVTDVLHELSEAGVVLRDQAGAAYQYRLNRDHLAAPSIVALARLRATLLDRIEHEAAGWSVPAVAVWLFGSVARGTADLSSDVDLLVLRPSPVPEDASDWTAQVSTLERHIQGWTGNEANVIEYGEDEFSSLVETHDRLVDGLRADAITIAGDAVLQRCRARRRR